MAQLPPKVPPHMTQNWPSFHHHHTLFPPPLPPSNPNQGQPSWMDGFLEYSPIHHRGTHRRSMSDSITTFLEEEQKHQGRRGHHGHHDYDGFNEEQLISMFSDNVVTLGDNSPALSDQNSNNADDDNDGGDQVNTGYEIEQQNEVKMCIDNTEAGEVESSLNFQSPLNGDCFGGGDTIIDPKRVKRILANRQSAQRSRVKKLQYISELELTVTLLQTEVSALSPRVAYLEHQRLILNMDNSNMKQKIAAMAQENIFKDAHEEALKKEIERLRQVYHHLQKGNKHSSNNTELAA